MRAMGPARSRLSIVMTQLSRISRLRRLSQSIYRKQQIAFGKTAADTAPCVERTANPGWGSGIFAGPSERI